MAEAVWASFEVGNKQSKRWTVPLGFTNDSSFVLFPHGKENEREDQREKIKKHWRSDTPGVIVRCIGARLCLRLAVPPCVLIRGMLPSYHARGTKRRSTLALAKEPPRRRNSSLPMGNM